MNTLEQLLRENKLEKIPINFSETHKLLKSAGEDISFAKKMLKLI